MIEILATFETIIASEWTLLLAILLLLSLSGLLSCSETSFTGSSQAKLHQYAREGDNRAQRVIGLIMNRQRLIGAILIGNNLVNIMASALASVWFFKIFGDVGVFYATMIMTMLIVIFAEVIPKNIALIKPEGVAMRMARPMKWTVKLFSPLVYLIDKLILPFIVNEKEKNQISSQEHEIELRGAIELHHNEEPETEEERKMLRSILDLDDTTVDSAMTHRTNVEMIDLDSDYDENIIRILENSYTRVPLYRSDHDRIVGVLHARNLLRAIGLTQSQNDKSKKTKQPLNLNGNEKIDLEKISAKPWFIPDTTSLYDQLQSFRERREHFALVVDEYGSFMGIITLEDILEEIVGTIHDEHDKIAKGIWEQENGSFVVDGAKSLRELNRELDWNLPEDGVSTVAGLILKETRMIPFAKQVFNFHGMRFEILERKRNRLERIRVIPLSEPSSPTFKKSDSAPSKSKL